MLHCAILQVMIKKITPGTQGNQFSPLRNILVFQIPTDDCKSFDCHFLKIHFPSYGKRRGRDGARYRTVYGGDIINKKKASAV